MVILPRKKNLGVWQQYHRRKESQPESEGIMHAFFALLSLVVAFIVGTVARPCLAGQGDVAAGKATYDYMCAMCHGREGKGDGPTAAVLNPKPRDHTNGGYMNELKDDYLFKIIKEGGASVGKSQLMPAWSIQVKDQGVWDLVAYIRTLAVPPYKPAAAEAASKPVTKPMKAADPKP